jgi:hypothetical protein
MHPAGNKCREAILHVGLGQMQRYAHAPNHNSTRDLLNAPNCAGSISRIWTCPIVYPTCRYHDRLGSSYGIIGGVLAKGLSSLLHRIQMISRRWLPIDHPALILICIACQPADIENYGHCAELP